MLLSLPISISDGNYLLLGGTLKISLNNNESLSRIEVSNEISLEKSRYNIIGPDYVCFSVKNLKLTFISFELKSA